MSKQSREELKEITTDFTLERLADFFKSKNRYFEQVEKVLPEYCDDYTKECEQFGEIKFENKQGRIKDAVTFFLIKISANVQESLGKKKQFDLARKILKGEACDHGIFVFIDNAGKLRISLIYSIFQGKTIKRNSYKRSTFFVDPTESNRTFIDQMATGDFTSLQSLKDIFSIEKVTKEFYKSIANWYFYAVDNCRFPKDAEEEENGRQIAVIRLITRMIFIWFMRERGLIPKNLFKENSITNILKKSSAKDTTYYTAILQNLFFATLSTKKVERRFGSEVRGHKGRNKDFGNQYVFRYHELFEKPSDIKKHFGDIPFLNGGLFESLDDKEKGIIIDGFSRTKKNQPTVPNFLFFSQEKNADLNKAYGTKNKKYKVSGLLDIFSYFNFTIDENTTDDADIALDPELLGKVFENLLASFNPETATTARKATGSYYTPREIVDYMVAESLKEYFKTHLSGIDDLEKKIDQLFLTETEEHLFSQKESKELVDLIEKVRIVDPAVGSGAFPMGILNKLVFLLSKLDHENKLWKQTQLEVADLIPDPSVKSDTKKRIEDYFENKNANYGRKLYLIQKCIYGVDIQKIAVEIAKLRFFISLLVDEQIDKNKDNLGIEPLPNLDFKIMQGNSLISEFMGIDLDNSDKKEEQQADLAFAKEDDSLIKEFEQKKIGYQNEPDKDKKATLKGEVEDLLIKIFEKKLEEQKGEYFKKRKGIEQKYSIMPNKQTREERISKEKQILSKKYGFDLENIEKKLREFTSKNKVRPFFLWKLYFAEVFSGKGGFDVVIGNPPYLRIQGLQKTQPAMIPLYRKNYDSAEGSFDIYALFIERGYKLLSSSGQLAYIVPHKFFQASFGKKLRSMIANKKAISQVVKFGAEQVFENPTTYTCLFFLSAQPKDSFEYIGVSSLKNLGETMMAISGKREVSNVERGLLRVSKDEDWNFQAGEIGELLKTLDKQPQKLGDVAEKIFVGLQTSADKIYVLKTVKEKRNTLLLYSKSLEKEVEIEKAFLRPFLMGKDVHRYENPSPKNHVIFPYLVSDTKAELMTLKNIKKNYPLGFDYIQKNKKTLEEREKGRFKNEWWCFSRPQNMTMYDKSKIMTPDIANGGQMTFDVEGIAHTTTLYSFVFKEGLKEDLKYWLGILNSKILWFFLVNTGSILRGGFFRFKTNYLTPFPIKRIDFANKKEKQAHDKIADLVDRILSTKKENPKADTSALEAEIDELVFDLYDLTPKERKLILNP